LFFYFCLLQYKNLICSVILYLVCTNPVFLLCILFPLNLICMYLAVSCLAVHILLYQMVGIVFSNFSFVFYRCYALLFVDGLLIQSLYWASCTIYYYPNQYVYIYAVHLLVCIINCTKCTVHYRRINKTNLRTTILLFIFCVAETRCCVLKTTVAYFTVTSWWSNCDTE
jgi:hypothetical protein